ncbi:CocE/NonD family hydrolase [Micromonospora sp. M12]
MDARQPRTVRGRVARGLTWLDEHLPAAPPAAGRSRRAAPPVRLHVGGTGGGWRDLPDWPPPATETAWHLHPDGELAVRPPVGSAPDEFRYDPADPTPSLGGPLLVAQRAGPVDNRRVEARPDVLTYTSAPLAAPVEVIGLVRAEIHMRSELPHLDVFVRLCDVDRRGRSWNVCDGLVRVTPERFPADPSGCCGFRCRSGRPRTGSWPGTDCGCRSPVAPIRAGHVTPAPANPRHGGDAACWLAAGSARPGSPFGTAVADRPLCLI